MHKPLPKSIKILFYLGFFRNLKIQSISNIINYKKN